MAADVEQVDLPESGDSVVEKAERPKIGRPKGKSAKYNTSLSIEAGLRSAVFELIADSGAPSINEFFRMLVIHREEVAPMLNAAKISEKYMKTRRVVKKSDGLIRTVPRKDGDDTPSVETPEETRARVLLMINRPEEEEKGKEDGKEQTEE